MKRVLSEILRTAVVIAMLMGLYLVYRHYQ